MNQGGTHRVSLTFYFCKLGFGKQVHFTINFYRSQASGSSAMNMETVILNYFFKRNKSVAEWCKVRGRLSYNGGGMTQDWKEPFGNRA